MDCCIGLVACCVAIAFIIVLIRFLFADADFSTLFKAKFGLKPESLKGKTVWITGASSGIGEFLAYDLARAGCTLVLSARRLAELERVRKQCLTSANIKEENIFIQQLDILDYNSHADVVKEVLSKVNKVDILVNNAGRSQRALISETSLDVDVQVIELNTFGTISLTKALLPHFIENKQGHFVVTSSVAGKVGAPLSASYTASKHALQGWFEALRIEHAQHNVDVTMVCPGPVYSNITQESFTGHTGEKHGTAMGKRENRMTTERCTELMVVAIANRMSEVWLSNQPILLFTYLFQYMPDIARWLSVKVGMKQILKVRESKI